MYGEFEWVFVVVGIFVSGVYGFLESVGFLFGFRNGVLLVVFFIRELGYG